MAKKESKNDAKSISLRDRIQNNIMVILIASGVAVAGVTAGVMHYMSTQHRNLLLTKHETTIQNLVADHKQEIKSAIASHRDEMVQFKTQLQSIERRLGDNDFFDVRQFFVNDARKLQLSNKAQFHSEPGFYAPVDEGRWQYTTMSEMDFLAYVVGEDNILYTTLANMVPEAESLGEVHIWKGVDEKWVEGTSPVRRLFPYVAVERVSYDELFGVLHKQNQDITEMMFIPESDEANLYKEFASEPIARIYRGDAVGALLASDLFIATIIGNTYPNVSYYIKNLQKKGNVVYLQAITTLRDITIDGTHYTNYFLTQEKILISTRDALYTVQTSVPNHEPVPRNEYFVWVNEWLGDFAVVLK